MNNKQILPVIKNIFLVLLVCIAVILYLMSISLNSRLGGVFQINNMNVRIDNIHGILSSLISLMCILMVTIDFKKGRILAYIFLTLQIGFMTIGIIRSDELFSLPGIYNSIVTIISVTLIYWQLSRSNKMSVTDYMTGLMNRRGLVKYIEKKVSEKNKLYLIYLELDNFRAINDNLGHKYGDMIIRIVAKRLNNYSDKDTFVSRIGGAEFAVVIGNKKDPREFATKLTETLGKDIVINDTNPININISIYAGISEYPTNAVVADELLKYADIAIYHIRKSPNKKVLFFDQNMKEELSKQIELEKIVKEALEKNWFYLTFQPQFKLKDKSLRGFETLLRLRLPDGTMISPSEFIPAVEKNDIILNVDRYVLTHAMQETKNLMNTSGRDDILISINISAKSISSEDFIQNLKQTIYEIGFPANNLELEITEYSLAENRLVTTNNINILRALGIKISLDDFGTGYTSLSQVLELPVDLIKIDKSMIDNIYDKPTNRDFLEAIIYMGHLMNCQVVAEGVELNEQLDFLKDHECDYVQGFIWGKPVTYFDALEVCKNSNIYGGSF